MILTNYLPRPSPDFKQVANRISSKILPLNLLAGKSDVLLKKARSASLANFAASALT